MGISFTIEFLPSTFSSKFYIAHCCIHLKMTPMKLTFWNSLPWMVSSQIVLGSVYVSNRMCITLEKLLQLSYFLGCWLRGKPATVSNSPAERQNQLTKHVGKLSQRWISRLPCRQMADPPHIDYKFMRRLKLEPASQAILKLRIYNNHKIINIYSCSK